MFHTVPNITPSVAINLAHIVAKWKFKALIDRNKILGLRLAICPTFRDQISY